MRARRQVLECAAKGSQLRVGEGDPGEVPVVQRAAGVAALSPISAPCAPATYTNCDWPVTLPAPRFAGCGCIARRRRSPRRGCRSYPDCGEIQRVGDRAAPGGDQQLLPVQLIAPGLRVAQSGQHGRALALGHTSRDTAVRRRVRLNFPEGALKI
jgi:hypothetical protein